MSGIPSNPKIAVGYIARGRDLGWNESLSRFCLSYQKYHAGVDHRVYVAFKGFDSAEDLARAQRLLSSIDHVPLLTGDEGFDIAAYRHIANQSEEANVCFLNSYSEILCDHWLLKLWMNFNEPGVGLVGATGSYESMFDGEKQPSFSPFPNPHIRSTAFLIANKTFQELTEHLTFTSKEDAFAFESGTNGMTRRILQASLDVRIVGKNGRGYSPKWWPESGTFRQGRQENLLVGDNQTRQFSAMIFPEKQFFAQRTWGIYLQEDVLLPE
ncbi:MAG: hypothetical protein ABUL43_03010 [Hyphomicrobium sp.]